MTFKASHLTTVPIEFVVVFPVKYIFFTQVA